MCIGSELVLVRIFNISMAQLVRLYLITRGCFWGWVDFWKDAMICFSTQPWRSWVKFPITERIMFLCFWKKIDWRLS